MVVQKEPVLLECRVTLALLSQESTNESTYISDVVPILALIEFELIFEEMVLLLENCDSGKPVREQLKHSFEHLTIWLSETGSAIVLNDPPEDSLGLYSGFDLHDNLEDVDALVACVIQAFDTKEQLDYVLLGLFLVVAEENVVADVGSDHVFIEHQDSGLCPLVEVSEHLFGAVVGALVAQGSLAVVTLHVAKDGQVLGIQVKLVLLLPSHTFLILRSLRSFSDLDRDQALLNKTLVVESIGILVELRVSPIIYIWIFLRLWCGRREHQLEELFLLRGV